MLWIQCYDLIGLSQLVSLFFRKVSPNILFYAGTESGHCHGACRHQWSSRSTETGPTVTRFPSHEGYTVSNGDSQVFTRNIMSARNRI